MARWPRRRSAPSAAQRPDDAGGPGPGGNDAPDAGPDADPDASPDASLEAGTEPTAELPGLEPEAVEGAPTRDASGTSATRRRLASRRLARRRLARRGSPRRPVGPDSLASRRRARRWSAWRRVAVAAAGAGVVAAAAWLVFFSSVLAVEGVRVEGAEVLSGATVRRAAEVPLGGPLATADLSAVSARVERLPAVASVDVSRSWPDRVRIEVREREAVAVVKDDGSGRLRGVDANGVVFRTYAERPGGLPVIRRSGDAGAEAVAEAATVAASLPGEVARRVAFVRVRTVDTITLRLRSGRTVRWGSADDSADKSRVLAVLLGQQARYYDVSVPGRPVIRR